MRNLKINLIFILLILLTNFSWSTNQGLNGLLTFDESDNFKKNRTGIVSFELIDGKATKGYKVATGGFPYAHKNGTVLFKQGCGLSIIDQDGFSKSVVPCPPVERFHQAYYEHPQLSPSGLFVAVELKKSFYNNASYRMDRKISTLVFDIKGNQIIRHDNFFAPTWLPDGRLLLSAQRNRYGLFVTDKSFKKYSQIDNNKLKEFAYYPDVSPSGKRVVFEYNQQIWIMNMDGTGLKRLLRGTKRLRYPTWSPDGTYIAYLIADASGYYDSGIYFYEVDGEHKQVVVNNKNIFTEGKTGYPDIIGPISWTSTESSKKEVSSNTEMPNIQKVGYSKESFSDLMELLTFTLGRKLTKSEKVSLVKSDYKYTRGNFKNRQKKMKKVLKKFSSINKEIQKTKDTNHAKILQKYMQEYFIMSYAKAPIDISNGVIPQLIKKERLAINIQEKKFTVVPVEYNKKSVLEEPIGIESFNLKKVRQSQWIKSFYQQHQAKNLHSVNTMRLLLNLIPNTKSTGLIESWNNNHKTINYYAKNENPLPFWNKHQKKGNKHYQLNNGLNVFLKPWGYILYEDINKASSFDNNAPIYLLDTSNIKEGYTYLLNASYIFSFSFAFNRKTPSDFQREMMSHINRLRFQLDGNKTPTINFDLWFDDEKYASTFIFLLKLKRIELKANYSQKTIDEWLLEKLNFKQEGKHVYINQTFTPKESKEFIKRLIDEIKMFS